MRRLRPVLLTGLALLIFVPLALWLLGIDPPSWRKPSDAPLPPIVDIQALSDLATTRVQIADFIEGENNNYKAKWSLHGEAVLGVDLSKAAYGDIDEMQRTATLRLPHPHIVSSKVDHERSDEVLVESKWIIPPVGIGLASLRAEVWKHADRKIHKLAEHDGYQEVTKLQTERVLEKLFAGLGWKVSILWCEAEVAPSPGG